MLPDNSRFSNMPATWGSRAHFPKSATLTSYDLKHKDNVLLLIHECAEIPVGLENVSAIWERRWFEKRVDMFVLTNSFLWKETLARMFYFLQSKTNQTYWHLANIYLISLHYYRDILPPQNSLLSPTLTKTLPSSWQLDFYMLPNYLHLINGSIATIDSVTNSL